MGKSKAKRNEREEEETSERTFSSIVKHLEAGDVLGGGRFKLTVLAGEGATAAVWEAIDTKVGRHVAIKIPRSEKGKERLEQEARVLSSVAHPNIVQYVDWFKDADPAFIVIEFLQGRR